MATIAISGHLKDSFGNPLVAAPVTFRLYNYNGNLPIVSGTNVLVPIVVELITDNAGLYSGNIQGNDTISPTGTVYEVNFGGGASASYSFSGAGPINLDSYPPVSSVPVPTGPIPANILGGNNIFTGANAFSGNNTHNGVETFTGGFQIGTTIQNVGATATMGITLKKGSGAGNYASASTSYVVVDVTNLCYTVTIPTGWKLSVTTSGNLGTATAAQQASAAITDNAACSTANAGILTESMDTGTGANVLAPFSLNWVINGDGAVHNVALQYKTSNASDSATMANSSATILPTMVFTLMPSN